MTVEEIRDHLDGDLLGLTSHTAEQVESVLRKGSEFIQVLDDEISWQFGFVAAPSKGQYLPTS